MPRLLLAGCGDLGTGLGLQMAQEGWEVWGLRRNANDLPKALQGWSADLTQTATLQAPPASFDSVVYTATPDEYDEAGYRRAYVDGVQNILDVLKAQEQPLQRFVLVSSTSVFAQNAGEVVDEASPTTPNHYSGRTILEGEDKVQVLEDVGVIVRFGGIYGPKRTQLLSSVQKGKAVCYDGSPRYTNRIHRDDCIGFLRHLLLLEHVEPLYLGVDSSPAPKNDVLNWLADALDREKPPVKPESERPQGRRSRSNKRCSNQRLLDSGYVLQYPSYQEGYTAILQQLQDNIASDSTP